MNPFDITDEEYYVRLSKLNLENNTDTVNLKLYNYNAEDLIPAPAEKPDFLDMDEVYTNADKRLEESSFYDYGWSDTESLEQAFMKQMNEYEQDTKRVFRQLGLETDVEELDEDEEEMKQILNYIDAFGKRNNLSDTEIQLLRARAVESVLKKRFNPVGLDLNAKKQEMEQKVQSILNKPSTDGDAKPPATGDGGDDDKDKRDEGDLQAKTMIDTDGGIHTETGQVGDGSAAESKETDATKERRPQPEGEGQVLQPDAPTPAPQARPDAGGAATGAGTGAGTGGGRINQAFLDRIEAQMKAAQETKQLESYKRLGESMSASIASIINSYSDGRRKKPVIDRFDELAKNARSAISGNMDTNKLTNTDLKLLDGEDIRSGTATSDAMITAIQQNPRYMDLNDEQKIIVVSNLDVRKALEEKMVKQGKQTFINFNQGNYNTILKAFAKVMIEQNETSQLNNLLKLKDKTNEDNGKAFYKAKSEDKPKYKLYLFDAIMNEAERTEQITLSKNNEKLGQIVRNVIELLEANLTDKLEGENKKDYAKRMFDEISESVSIRLPRKPIPQKEGGAAGGGGAAAPAEAQPEPPASGHSGKDEPYKKDLTEVEKVKLNSMLDKFIAEVIGEGGVSEASKREVSDDIYQAVIEGEPSEIFTEIIGLADVSFEDATLIFMKALYKVEPDANEDLMKLGKPRLTRKIITLINNNKTLEADGEAKEAEPLQEADFVAPTQARRRTRGRVLKR